MPDVPSKLSEVIDVRTGGPPASGSPSVVLAKAATLEIRRLTLAKGREIPAHRAAGEITVHCLEGRIAFTAAGLTREIGAGQLIVLSAGEPHSLVCLEDAVALVTKVNPPIPAPTA
jgi:quercetin dioxygenase-like cupin family protein